KESLRTKGRNDVERRGPRVSSQGGTNGRLSQKPLLELHQTDLSTATHRLAESSEKFSKGTNWHSWREAMLSSSSHYRYVSKRNSKVPITTAVTITTKVNQ